MSALLIDLPLAQAPAVNPRRWMHVVPDPAAVADLHPAALPDPVVHRLPLLDAPATNRRAAATRPVVAPAAPLRLTRRGLAVVVGGFALVMMTALVVLVTSFLAVSNDPLISYLPLG